MARRPQSSLAPLPASHVCLLLHLFAHRRVRHEAGEALGAIGKEQCLEALRRHLQDAVKEVGLVASKGGEELQQMWMNLQMECDCSLATPQPEPSLKGVSRMSASFLCS